MCASIHNESSLPAAAAARFSFVENEKAARLDVEASVGRLLQELAELRGGTLEQVGTRGMLRVHGPSWRLYDGAPRLGTVHVTPALLRFVRHPSCIGTLPPCMTPAKCRNPLLSVHVGFCLCDCAPATPPPHRSIPSALPAGVAAWADGAGGGAAAPAPRAARRWGGRGCRRPYQRHPRTCCCRGWGAAPALTGRITPRKHSKACCCSSQLPFSPSLGAPRSPPPRRRARPPP
jgi:hypothetical protein